MGQKFKSDGGGRDYLNSSSNQSIQTITTDCVLSAVTDSTVYPNMTVLHTQSKENPSLHSFLMVEGRCVSGELSKVTTETHVVGFSGLAAGEIFNNNSPQKHCWLAAVTENKRYACRLLRNGKVKIAKVTF